LHIRFAQPPPVGALDGDGVSETGRLGDRVTFEIRANLNRLLTQAVPFDVLELENEQVTLEEVFMTYYGQEGSEGHD
jgi:branched-subunit amino acid aminotransferase/4-amino-4-deoxychorismate lyase